MSKHQKSLFYLLSLCQKFLQSVEIWQSYDKQDNVRTNTESVQCRDFFSREPISRPNIPTSRLTLH